MDNGYFDRKGKALWRYNQKMRDFLSVFSGQGAQKQLFNSLREHSRSPHRAQMAQGQSSKDLKPAQERLCDTSARKMSVQRMLPKSTLRNMHLPSGE